MIATRTGISRLLDWQAIIETMLFCQYGAFSIKPGWTVLDIGASIGDFSIWAKRQGADRVVAYECDLFCAPALRRNAERHKFEVCLQRVETLQGLPDADLVKIDIEGGEFNLFPNARYPRIIMEYHKPYGNPEILQDILKQSGYQTAIKANWHRQDIGMLISWRPN
ncbi:MAG: hypothetical protein V1793_09815 [Pseudomonadota bacterium]